MNKIGKQELIFVVLLVLLPLTAWFAVFSPNKKATEPLRDENQKTRDCIERSTMLYQKVMPKLNERIAKVEEAQKLIDTRQPSRQNTSDIKQKVGAIAERNGLEVKFQDRRHTPPEEGQHYGNQKIGCDIQGPYRAFYKFLQELEALPMMLEIEQLGLSQLAATRVVKDENAESKVHHVRASMILKFYYKVRKSD